MCVCVHTNTHTRTHTHTHSSNYTVVNFKCMSFGPIQVLLYDVDRLISNFPNAKILCVYCPLDSELTNSQSFLKALETNIAPLKLDSPLLAMGAFNLTKIDCSIQRPTVNHPTADYRLILASQRFHLTQLVS